MLNEYEPSGSQTWLQEQTDVKLKRAYIKYIKRAFSHILQFT